MKDTIKALLALPFLLSSSIVWAQGSNDATLLQTRTQLQTKMHVMSDQDRAINQQLNQTGDGRGNGSGERKQLRDESGKGSARESRSQQYQKSGYGSGYGSRSGGGRHGR